MAIDVRVKRAYEPAEPADGYRVLVERLWPRGVTKEEASLDEWAKDVAPSAELRRWYGHDVERFEEFRCRYLEELDAQGERLEELRARARRGTLTLVYAARDTEHNSAVLLADVLRGS